jgi:hypothetical protein
MGYITDGYDILLYSNITELMLLCGFIDAKSGSSVAIALSVVPIKPKTVHAEPLVPTLF